MNTNPISEKQKIITEIECNLLAIIMHNLPSAHRAIAKLTSNNFALIRHQIIFQAITALIHDNKSCELELVHQWLLKNKQLTTAGGLTYLTEVNETFISQTRFDDYLQMLINYVQFRELQGVARWIDTTTKKTHPTEVQQLLQDAEAKLLNITAHFQQSDFEHIQLSLTKTWEHLEKLAHSTDTLLGITSGIIGLDKLTLGFQPGDLVILAGRPSMGKSALALNFLVNAAIQKNINIAFLSLEIPIEQLLQRLLSLVSKINLMKVKNPVSLNKEEWGRLANAKQTLTNTNIFFRDTTNAAFYDIQSQIMHLVHQKNLDLVVIDYLQLITTKNTRFQSRQQELAFISQALKQLARRINAPIICLSQLSRAVEKREDKRPLMSDLRDSGAIEQDADLIMFLYRGSYYNNSEDQVAPAIDDQVELIIRKHRNGPVGTVHLNFNLEYGEFLEQQMNSYA